MSYGQIERLSHSGSPKALALATLALLLALSMAALAGCSSESEDPDPIPKDVQAGEAATAQQQQEASAAMAATLQPFADGDSQAAAELLSQVGFDPADFGISWDTFCQLHYGDFSFEVTGWQDSLDAAGGVGVDITVQVRQMPPTLKALKAANEDAISAGAKTSKADYARKWAKKQLSKADIDTHELSATLYVAPDGQGGWRVEDPCSLATLLLDGYDPRQA